VGNRVGQQRLNAARELGSRLIRDPHLRTSMPHQESGDQPVMVVAANERIQRFFARADIIELPLTIAVRHEGQLAIVFVRPVEGTGHQHDDWDNVLNVHPNITMGMMVDTLWNSGGSILVHLVEDDEDAWETDYEVVAGV
jgi:hypothetical protein